MSFWQAYITCAGGVVLSIVLPVLSKAVRQHFDTGGPAEFSSRRSVLLRAVWRFVHPYVVLGAFSLAVALLIIAFSGELLRTWKAALIAGYLWDSTLQKIVGRP